MHRSGNGFGPKDRGVRQLNHFIRTRLGRARLRTQPQAQDKSANTRLVSNLPFGERFARVPTAKLLRFIAGLGLPPERMVLLTSRRQGMAMAPALGLRAKNVLLLGQPASILHGGAPDARR